RNGEALEVDRANGTARVITVDDAAEGAALPNTLADRTRRRRGRPGSGQDKRSVPASDEVEAVHRRAVPRQVPPFVPLEVAQSGRLGGRDDGGRVVMDEVQVDGDVPQLGDVPDRRAGV